MEMKLTLQPEDSGYCVPCAIKSILDFYGIDVSLKDVIKGCGSSYTQGTDDEKAEEFLKSHGLIYAKIKFDFKSIHKSIKEKNPVAVAYMNDVNESHFSIIKDCYKKRNIEYVLLNDSYFGDLELPLSLLKVLYKESGKFNNGNAWIRKIIKKNQKKSLFDNNNMMRLSLRDIEETK